MVLMATLSLHVVRVKWYDNSTRVDLDDTIIIARIGMLTREFRGEKRRTWPLWFVSDVCLNECVIIGYTDCSMGANRNSSRNTGLHKFRKRKCVAFVRFVKIQVGVDKGERKRLRGSS